MSHVTSQQLRAARSYLGERLIDAAERSGVPLQTVWRAEQSPDGEVPDIFARTLSTLVRAYEEAGCRFVNRDGAVGVLFPVDAGSADKGG